MKIAFFDCFSGAAGDMILGACLDAGLPESTLREQLARLNLDDVEIKIEKTTRRSLAATSFHPVITAHHDHHRHLTDITDIINRAGYNDRITQNALDIFQRLAAAEAKVHDTTIDKVHFHEVGAADAIIDIVGVCIALDAFEVEKVFCSPLTIGSGTVKCDHGILPVPAPATAEMIKGIPTAPSDIDTELLTPTGAAILTTLAQSFGPAPAMTITDIGYGAGQTDFPQQANVLRLILGQTDSPTPGADADEIWTLEANLDDAPGELLGHTADKLFDAGALDVFTTPLVMKKNRPGALLTVLCSLPDAARLEEIIFRETTTFGIRRRLTRRSILPREHRTVDTPYGPIRIKCGYFNGKIIPASPEFSDCQAAAQKHNVPLKQVTAAAQTAFKPDD